MAVNFILSAFADEYSTRFDEQIEGLRKNNISLMEIRGVDGKSISELSVDEAKEIKAKLDANGIGISSIGSPVGKIKITDDFCAHLESLKHQCELAHILNAKRLRMFSFYGAEKLPITDCKAQVIEKIGRMLEAAEAEEIKLCHENEKGIYGDIPRRCREILEALPSLGCVFDHANFIQSGAVPYPDGYELLKSRITYMHIKDALEDGRIVPAGQGIGRITETLRDINDSLEGDFILTVEPHLRVFAGLSSLEGGERTKLGNAYETSAEAFAAAAAGIRSCISRI